MIEKNGFRAEAELRLGILVMHLVENKSATTFSLKFGCIWRVEINGDLNFCNSGTKQNDNSTLI